MTRKYKSNRNAVTYAIGVTAFAFLVVCIAAALLLVYGSESVSSRQTPREAFGLEKRAALSDDYVAFMDVGEGDCVFATSSGETLLIDVGPLSGGKTLCAKLRSAGVSRIDRLLITHFHNDHIGALAMVCDKFEVESLIMPNTVIAEKSDDISDVLKLKTELLRKGKSVLTATSGMAFSVGDLRLSILMCDTTAKTENNRSVAARLDFKDTGFLCMSDIAKASEEKLIELKANLSCDVLKVGHHGAKSSTNEDFLEICKPEFAVISCGADNTYGHPAAAVLNRLDKVKAQTYRTDISGDVIFYLTESGIEIETENPHK